MERYLTFGYSSEHETSSNRCAIGKTASPSHSSLERQQISLSSGPQARRIKKFGLAMGTHLQTARAKRVTRTPESWSALLLEQLGEGAPRHHLTSRRTCHRVSNRVMDLRADCQGNLAAISRSLSSACDLASAARDGVELSETPAPCPATGRGQGRALEALRVAPYKKRLPNVEPIWFSWMKVGFCLSLISSAPGPRRDRPLSARCATSKGRSMPSVPWPCRPSAKNWRSTCSSRLAILRVWRSRTSSNISCPSSGGRSSCYGIGARFIGVDWSRISYCNILGYGRNISLPMPLNSTRLNMCGIELTML